VAPFSSSINQDFPLVSPLETGSSVILSNQPVFPVGLSSQISHSGKLDILAIKEANSLAPVHNLAILRIIMNPRSDAVAFAGTEILIDACKQKKHDTPLQIRGHAEHCAPGHLRLSIGRPIFFSGRFS
jgi:hypothetical protein